VREITTIGAVVAGGAARGVGGAQPGATEQTESVGRAGAQPTVEVARGDRRSGAKAAVSGRSGTRLVIMQPVVACDRRDGCT
jgi:hypothetical protein